MPAPDKDKYPERYEEYCKKISERNKGKNHHFYGKKRPNHSKRMSGNNNPNYGKKERPWLDGEANPAKRKSVREKISKKRKNVKLSPETRKKISKHKIEWFKNEENRRRFIKAMNREDVKSKFSEKNCHFWKGGISNDPYCSIFTNKEFREMIYKRDNYTCQNCGITRHLSLKIYSQNLHIHHIDYDKKNCDTRNCITTCCRCNTKANSYRWMWYLIYSDMTGDESMSYFEEIL